MGFLQVCYLLFVVATISCLFRSFWKDYRAGFPFGKGRFSASYYITIFSIIANQLVIPSFLQRMIMLLAICFVAIIFYGFLQIHNQRNNHGETFSYYDKIFRKDKKILCVVGIVLLVAMVFIESLA